MSTMQKTDILIIGAGPSGSSAAALLKQKGYDVTIIEKQHFPRFSIGESLLPQCMVFLEEAGLPSDVYNSDDFKISFIKYWDDITGGELMSKSFIFSDEFRSLTTISFYDLEKHIKSYIVKLSKT